MIKYQVDLLLEPKHGVHGNIYQVDPCSQPLVSLPPPPKKKGLQQSQQTEPPSPRI